MLKFSLSSLENKAADAGDAGELAFDFGSQKQTRKNLAFYETSVTKIVYFFEADSEYELENMKVFDLFP